MSTRWPALRAWLIDNPPVVAFGLVYFLTCYVGAIFLLVGGPWVREAYVFLSGVHMPPLDGGMIVTLLVLLHLAPLALIAGWMLTERLPAFSRARRRLLRTPPRAAAATSGQRRLALALLCLAVLYFVFRAVSVGGISPSAWYDYTQLIDARERLLASLQFWDFALIYSVIPLLAGFLIAEEIVSSRPRRATMIRVGALTVALLAVNLALFQKRSAIAALLLAGAYVFLRADCWERLGIGVRKRSLAGAVSLVLLVTVSIYFAALIFPLVRPSSTAVPTPPAAASDRSLGSAFDFEKGAAGWTGVASSLDRKGGRTFVTRGHRGSGLELLADKPGEGVMVPLEQSAPAGSQWRIRTWLRSERPAVINLLIGGAELQKFAVRTTSKWQPYSFAWSPAGEVPSVAFGLETTAPARIGIDQVRVRAVSLLPTKPPRLEEAFGLPVTPRPAIERAKRRHELFLKRRREARERRREAAGGGAFGPGLISGVGLPGGALNFPDVYEVERRSREEQIALTAMFGPLMRTAGPAVAYPAIYPDRHPYYAPDVGLDLAGIGADADDNVSSWNAMFPETPGGTNSVPYQFTLYSQGGVIVALIGSLLLGIIWRLLWEVGYLKRERTLSGPAIGALAIVFGVTIAADAWRNAFLASYGIFWPIVVIVGASAIGGLVWRLTHGIDAGSGPPDAVHASARQ